jgi:hypothetical protein
MATEEKAYIKGRKIVRSCNNHTQLMNAYNWIWLYKNMYGETENWKHLLNYCTKRRNRL